MSRMQQKQPTRVCRKTSKLNRNQRRQLNSAGTIIAIIIYFGTYWNVTHQSEYKMNDNFTDFLFLSVPLSLSLSPFF